MERAKRAVIIFAVFSLLAAAVFFSIYEKHNYINEKWVIKGVKTRPADIRSGSGEEFYIVVEIEEGLAVITREYNVKKEIYGEARKSVGKNYKEFLRGLK